MRFPFLFIFLLMLILSGCFGGTQKAPHLKSKRQIEQKDREKQLKKLVQEAEKYLRTKRWDLAEESLREIRDRYPDSLYALWAELKMADCKFFAHKYQEAVVLYQEFEKLHPTNEAIPYVIYQIGTCYYNLILSPDRDQTFTKKALLTYERLLKSFPGSPYELEIKKRIKKCRERLADHEMYVARFYFRTKRYRAAYYRLLYLLQSYPETRAALEARKLRKEYYQKSLEETKALAEGTLKDFWGRPVR